jgi:hypothetical protein
MMLHALETRSRPEIYASNIQRRKNVTANSTTSDRLVFAGADPKAVGHGTFTPGPSAGCWMEDKIAVGGLVFDASVTRGTAAAVPPRPNVLERILNALGRDDNEINRISLKESIQLLNLVPKEVPEPNLAFSDEETILDWAIGDYCIVVSLVGDGDVAYSYRNLGQFVSGKQRFTISNMSLPEDFADYLEAMYS